MEDEPLPSLSSLDFPSLTLPRELGALESSELSVSLGPFQISGAIGRGGMGIVFAGNHLTQRVPVAIKVITRKGAEHPRFRQALRNEVQAVARLNHPGIVQVLDYGDISRVTESESNGELRAQTPYYVMEYLKLGTLSSIVGRVTWRQAKSIILSILDALAHAHAMGLVHRDIKPGNILLGEFAGRVVPKLADFGLAYAVEKSERAARSIGTPPYMAPEQIAQPWRKHGPWTDLYAVGCVAFELLTGMRAFSGSSIKETFDAHLKGERREFKSVVRVPDGFHDWLNRILTVDLQARFQSAAEASRFLGSVDERNIGDIRPPEATELALAGLTPVLDAFWVGESRQDTFQRAWSSMPSVVLENSPIPSAWNTPRYEPIPPRLAGAGLGLFGLRVTPLIGRHRELDSMWTALRKAAGTRSLQTVTILGPDGVGRTRLGDWFGQRCSELAVASVLSATHPDETPGLGLRALIKRIFRTHGSTFEETKVIVNEFLTTLGVATDYNVRGFSELLRESVLPVHEAPFEFSTSRQRYALILALLRRMAAEKPVVLWLDDAHRDSDTLDFVRFLIKANRLDPIPALLMVSIPSEALGEQPHLEELCAASPKESQVEIELRELNLQEHVQMIRDLLHLEEDLALTLGERTAGNPRMAVELISNWVAKDQLVVTDQGFQLKSGVVEIPKSLKDVWNHRVEAAIADFPDWSIALEVAASLGQEIDTYEWEMLCERAGIEASPDLVVELTRRRLLKSTSTGFEFHHVMVKEVLEAASRAAGTWERNARWAAELMERLYDMTRPTYSRRYAEYLIAGGFAERSIEPLFYTAQAFRRAGDFNSAQHVSLKILKTLQGLGTPLDQSVWGLVWSLRARTFLNQSKPADALIWAKQAIEAAKEFGWKEVLADALTSLAMAKRWVGAADAEVAIQEAYDVFRTLEDADPSVGGALSHVLISERRFDEARDILSAVFSVRSEARDLALNHQHRSRLAIFEEDWENAMVYSKEALRRFQALGHFAGVAQSLECVAEVHRKNGDSKEAAQIYNQCIDLQRAIGLPTVISQINLGSILLDEGSYDESERLFLLAAETLRTMGQRRFEFVAITGVLASSAGAARWASVRSLLKTVEEMMDETMEREAELGQLLIRTGEIAHAQSKLNEAETAFRLAIRQFEYLGKEEVVRALRERIKALDAFPSEFHDLD